MGAKLFLLTQPEIDLLNDLLKRTKGITVNPPLRPPPFPDNPQAPGTYIAWPPSGGIPALTIVGTTGPGGNDQPGSATCDIYKIDEVGTAAPELVEIDGLDKTVYNLSLEKVPQHWTVIQKTKSGSWVVVWAAHQAKWIKFVVNNGSGFAVTDSSVAVDGVIYVDGYEPDTAITTVHNEPASGVSTFIFEGDDDDIGQARYDPGNDKYWIDMMECP